MRIEFFWLLVLATLVGMGAPYAQPPAGAPQSAERQTATAPEDTEVWEPVPKVVTPGANNMAPPSDAIVLFDGKNLDEWVSAQDKAPAKWIVASDVLTVNKAAGNDVIFPYAASAFFGLATSWNSSGR